MGFYPLHRAVFDNDLVILRNNLVSNVTNNTKWIEWNEIDPSGDSTLMMAYRLER